MRILKLALSVLTAGVMLTSCAQNIENEDSTQKPASAKYFSESLGAKEHESCGIIEEARQ